MYTRISRRQFLVRGGKAALGAGLAGSLLAGCGGGSGGGRVTYWSNLTGSGPQAYFKKNIEKPFEKANKGTDLKVTFQDPEQLDRLIRTALQGRQGPDIIMTPGPAYAQEYTDANLLAELDEYSDQYKWEEKLLGWALDVGRYDGRRKRPETPAMDTVSCSATSGSGSSWRRGMASCGFLWEIAYAATAA